MSTSTEAPPAGTETWPSRDALATPGTGARLVHRAIVRWSAWEVRSYYRDLEVRGEEFPKDAPVLVVQNHTNGLCDAHTLMSLTRRPIRILVKYKLMKLPVIGWMLRQLEAVPVYRKKDGVDTSKNASSFEAIDHALTKERSVIALFPEGESLNSIGLRPLHSGVGRMAMSALEAGSDDLLIVPVGVTFERRDRYRTKVSALIGPPLHVASLVEDHPGEARAKAKSLVKLTRAAMADLILDAEDDSEHDAAVALERVMPGDDRPLGIRRKDALERVRRGADRNEESRRTALTTLGERLEALRLTGDDVLGPSPSVAPVVRAMLFDLPWFTVCLVTWCVPLLASNLIARLRRTPDKLVTLRCLFAFAGHLVWTPVLVLVGTLLHGPWGGAATLALAWLSIATFKGTVDRLLDAKRVVALRALHRDPEAKGALDGAITTIRSHYGLGS